MSSRDDNTQRPVFDPVLVSPLQAASVDGNSVLFSWEPVEGATEYELEVSPEPSFEPLIVKQNLERRTDVTVMNVFPCDESLFYWRVLAKGAGGWSPGEHVESFLSCEDVPDEPASGTPDEKEDLGPAAALFKSASVEAAAEVTDDDELYRQEAIDGVQHEGIEAGQILGIALAVLAAIVMAIIVVFQMTNLRYEATLSSVTSSARYPELRETERKAEQLLKGYGAVDAENGVYRIPIERAMDLMINEAYQRGERAYSEELLLRPQD